MQGDPAPRLIINVTLVPRRQNKVGKMSAGFSVAGLDH